MGPCSGAMRWILHVGTQKTGSKALQDALSRGAFGPRVEYPSAGRVGSWHMPIYHELMAGQRTLLVSAVEQASASGRDFGVLSCEAFHEMPVPALEILLGVAGVATIVVFLRRQDCLANSFLNQLVKAHRIPAGEITAFEDGLAAPMGLLDHRSTLERWGSVFGLENLVPLLYEPGTDTVESFGRALGLDGPPGVRPASNPNPALDAYSYVVFRKLKSRVADRNLLPRWVELAHRRLRHRFVDTQARGKPPLDLLGPAERERILAAYGEGNEWIRARWFPDRSRLFGSSKELGEPVRDWSVGDAEVEWILSQDPEGA